MWPTPTHQDSRIGPDNIGGSQHRAERGSVALADVVLFQAPGDRRDGAPDDTVNRVNRLKALGNAIVPPVAAIFAGAILDYLTAPEHG